MPKNVQNLFCKGWNFFNSLKHTWKHTWWVHVRVHWPKGLTNVYHAESWLEVTWPFNISVSSLTPSSSLPLSLSQLKSPGSCSSHVASSARPESAHPPILLPWHFQENPSRLGACLINPRERGREEGREGESAVLTWQLLSAGSSRATDAHCNTDNPPQPS